MDVSWCGWMIRIAGKIWLVSKETLASIPELYAQMESQGPTVAERIMPAALTGRQLLGMSLAQWLGWLLSIPISWLLAWLLGFLLSPPRRVWCKAPKTSFQNSLGYASGHAAQVHHCDPDPRPFRLPA